MKCWSSIITSCISFENEVVKQLFLSVQVQLLFDIMVSRNVPTIQLDIVQKWTEKTIVKCDVALLDGFKRKT